MNLSLIKVLSHTQSNKYLVFVEKIWAAVCKIQIIQNIAHYWTFYFRVKLLILLYFKRSSEKYCKLNRIRYDHVNLWINQFLLPNSV